VSECFPHLLIKRRSLDGERFLALLELGLARGDCGRDFAGNSLFDLLFFFPELLRLVVEFLFLHRKVLLALAYFFFQLLPDVLGELVA
jgi:hypothetical protein